MKSPVRRSLWAACKVLSARLKAAFVVVAALPVFTALLIFAGRMTGRFAPVTDLVFGLIISVRTSALHGREHRQSRDGVGRQARWRVAWFCVVAHRRPAKQTLCPEA